MSRPRFARALLALAILAAASIALAACAGGGDKSGESAGAVLEEATLEGIESAKIDLALAVKAPGAEGGNLDLTLSGPFQGEGRDSLPQLDLKAVAKGRFDDSNIDFDGGLVLLPNDAYVEYKGVTYEVDPTTFAFVESTLKQAQREAGAETGAAGVAGCEEEFGQLEVADFLEDGANEGSAEVGGVNTTKVSGDLNVSGAIDALVEVAESGACRAQLAAAGPLPSKAEIEDAKDEVSGSVKATHVDVYVGDDDIVRRVSARLKLEPKGDGKGPKRIEIDLDLKLTGVNEEQRISAPQGKAQPLSKLFIKLGVNPIELLGLLQGEGGGEDLGELLGKLGEAAGQ